MGRTLAGSLFFLSIGSKAQARRRHPLSENRAADESNRQRYDHLGAISILTIKVSYPVDSGSATLVPSRLWRRSLLIRELRRRLQPTLTAPSVFIAELRQRLKFL
jgi:hypothetical protein